MTTLIMLLLTVIFGWIVSGSVMPAFTVLITCLFFYSLILLRFPLNRLLFAAGSMLVVTLQALSFRNGYAGIIYEDLPASYHIAMGCFLWSWMVAAIKDGSRQKVAGWYFYSSLAGALFLFWTAASVEIFRFPPYLVRIVATTPLVLTLWKEFHRKELAQHRQKAWLLVLLLPLAGLTCSGSRSASSQLKKWLKKEDTFTYELGDSDENASRSGVSLSSGEGIVELPRKANIAVDKTTRFYLKVATLEDFLALTRKPLYLRTSAVSIFETDEKIRPIKKGRWILDGDDGTSDQITTLPGRDSKHSFNYAVVLPKEDAKIIPLVAGTRRIYADEVFHFSESRYQLEQPTEAEWVRFSAIGPLEARIERFPPRQESADSPHLTLPNTALAAKVRNLTESFAGSQSPANEISDYLQERCRYSLKYRNPANLTPIENLLFGEKKGHCELFASATVMMLRSVGIPSRIAYGYTGGASNREELAIAFRGSDIHAWAEILNERGEWQIFDTTPTNRGAARLARATSNGGIDWKMAAFNPEAGMNLSDDESGNRTAIALLFANFSDWSASYFLYLMGGLAVILFAGRWIFTKWWSPNSTGVGNIPGSTDLNESSVTSKRPDFVNAILSLGEKAGIPRQPGVTLREYVKSLNDQGVGYKDLTEAVEYFYEVQYGNKTANPTTERGFLRSIRAYEKGKS
ncbi:MAG: transglutaminase domain-containing protein [Verrucomicrobiales bacterium]|nr:transglutaminase domain-containing protein [Verrucomicrobiales bacterium]